MKRDYQIIGACSCWGAQIRSCERGPAYLIEGHILDRLRQQGISIRDVELLYPSQQASDAEASFANALSIIRDFNLQLYRRVRQAIQNKLFPIVLGGDHVNAVGTWSAVEEPFGLIWIDAHMDAHTPETTPSGAYHGMPVAALLGYGAPELVHLAAQKPVLQPQNLALIGARSFEKGEADLLRKLNVKVYFMDEVEKRGLKAIVLEAIAHVTRGVAHFGVSLDLDVFTVQEAPGVGSREKGGIHEKELVPLLSLFGMDPRLIAFEIVEFNPERDIDHRTRELIFHILTEVMK